MADYIRVNNTRFSWASTRSLIDGFPFESMVGLDYEQKRERKIVYSQRQDGTPVGWTSGKYSTTLKAKFLREGATALKEQLATGGSITPGLGSYGDAEWTFMLQTVEPVIGSVPITLIGSPCTIIGERESREEGIVEIVTEFDIACLGFIENGWTLYSIQRGLGV